MKRSLYQADWATEADDAELRRLMRETVQEGAVTLSFEREPSFFDSMPGAMRHDTVAVRRVANGEIIACGTRMEQQVWLHGRMQTEAYLGDLRVHPSCRQFTGRVLQAGFERLRELENQRPSAITYTAIFDDNQRARHALESGRIGLPAYHDQGALHTAAILVPRRIEDNEVPSVDYEEVAALLNERRRLCDLAPIVQATHLKSMRAVLISRQQGKLTGVAALCDMRGRRQMRVHGYHGTLRSLRHPLSWLLRLCGFSPLASPGETIPAVFVSFLEADNLLVAQTLLRRLRSAAAILKAGMLILTQHESDPLRSLQKSGLSIRSRGRIYEVAWDAAAPITSLHLPHVEGFSL